MVNHRGVQRRLDDLDQLGTPGYINVNSFRSTLKTIIDIFKEIKTHTETVNIYAL